MKKILLSSILASSLLLANSYEITPMIGYVDTKEHVDIENHKIIGVGVSRILSEESKFSSLEIGLLQSGDADYDNNAGSTKITQVFYNATKDYKINDSFKLYALAGLGYEYLSSEKLGNESDLFANYGVGAAYSFSKDLSIKLDARHALKFDGDKNVIYTLGLGIVFGKNAKNEAPIKKVVDLDLDKDSVLNDKDQCPKTPFGVKVDSKGCELDSDNDGVVDSKDTCRITKEGAKVDSTGCTLLGLSDNDKDGILDSKDQCLNTPTGATVDAKGCEVLDTPADLGIIFETNSATIKSNDIVKFERYVTYLNSVPTATIILEAHTDSVGNEQYNLELSQRRAQSTKQQLISMGISEDRIVATGYGETKPLVANDSEENMNKNRRVTARIKN